MLFIVLLFNYVVLFIVFDEKERVLPFRDCHS